ncbi:MAG TPA: ATP-binding protein, partial [Thermoanaerobaculia bacterium]|nr:ATP-binding protein [Thermoanaerobaculia bacterium]
LHETVHHHRPDGSVFPIEECEISKGLSRLVAIKDHRDFFIRKDGTFFPVSCHLEPLRGRHGGAVLEFRDITEDLRAQEALKEADRRKDEFIATLSHELRTPLTAILGWARILRLPGNDNDTVHTAIETINRSAEMQAQLIDDVLDISRITTGKVQIASNVVNVAEVAKAALETVQLAASARAIRMVSNLDAREPLVLGDANRLQQVVWNLLSNAIKFTPEGGEVRLDVRRSGSEVSVIVKDSGIGIRPDFLPHIFEPFRQAESTSTRVHGGLGLGLSIVRYLVELHGGRISAESTGNGEGSTFIVELPRLRAAAALADMATDETADAPASERRELTSLENLSVLVIDDQPDLRQYISEVLRRAGAKASDAASVREGIAAVERDAPNVVLCDIAMPHEDGFVFIEWMRKQARAIPVVAITAFGGENDEERVMAAGFASYIRKPVEPSDLSRAVAGAARRA